ncbi:4560_t:CDS:2 [Entrophospora sp. SA101]|nr:4560_t:CDS:2 [Entrophospora sp. SA101]
MKKDSYTELTTRNRPWGVTTNDEIDLPETCDEVGENKIELDLQEPSVVRIIKDNSEGLDWDTVMHKEYKKKLDESKEMIGELSQKDVQLSTRKRNVDKSMENTNDKVVNYERLNISSLYLYIFSGIVTSGFSSYHVSIRYIPLTDAEIPVPPIQFGISEKRHQVLTHSEKKDGIQLLAPH